MIFKINQWRSLQENITISFMVFFLFYLENILCSFKIRLVILTTLNTDLLSSVLYCLQAHRQTIGEPISSEPDSLGLVSRSISIRFPAERNKHSRGADNAAVVELKCESALPGVPIPPQLTTLVIPLRSPHTDPQVINNQKLHWYSSISSASSANIIYSSTLPLNLFARYFDMVKSFLFIEVVRWFIVN